MPGARLVSISVFDNLEAPGAEVSAMVSDAAVLLRTRPVLMKVFSFPGGAFWTVSCARDDCKWSPGIARGLL